MNKQIQIKLTYGQISVACHVATMRQTSNIVKGVPPKYGGASNRDGSWEIHIDACLGEMAVARYLNLFWCGALNNFKARDVGGVVDVRTTKGQNNRLILHPEDPDGTPFVLVWNDAPTFHLQGWILARDGKSQTYWLDPGTGRPAFFVPQQDLRPMPDLRQLVADWRGDGDSNPGSPT